MRILFLILLPFLCVSQSCNKKTLEIQNISHSWVAETVSRTANTAYSYTGTVRTCGAGGTYSTLTQAYAACSTGDIIQVMDGTIQLNAEAGGYWLINTAKAVLVRGNSADRTACVLTQTAAASFAVRVRVNSGIVFKDLTISSSNNTSCLYIDTDEANRNIISDNCVFNNTGSGSSSRILTCSGTADTKSNYVEFKDCSFSQTLSSALPFTFTGCGVNTTFLFTGCQFNALLVTPFIVNDVFKGHVKCYNNVITQGASFIAVQFGSDTSVPTNTLGSVDFRGNKIIFNPGFVQHALLMGRGTDSVYCVNNLISVPTSTDPLAIGIVVKSVGTTVGRALFLGNYVTAPRPFYIKGGKNTTSSYNTFQSNNSAWEAFGFTNHKSGADEALAQTNVITYNTFYTQSHAIHTYSTGAAQADDVTFKTCTVNNNNYYWGAQYFLYDAVNTANYLWQDKATFWGNTNDNRSKMVSKENFPVTIK